MKSYICKFESFLILSIFALTFSELLNCNSHADLEGIKCVKKISHEIISIDLLSDNSDLSFLRKILQEDSVKIVMLGEQSHYDGTTFLGKTKLIKFLHEELGFDVLAFESGLYDCYKAWELIQNEKDYGDGLKSSIFGFWSYSNEFKPLIKYLQGSLDSPSPVILSGFDTQLSGLASQKYLLNDFYKMKVVSKNSEEYEQLSRLLDFIAFDNQNNSKISQDIFEINSNNKLIDTILYRLNTLKTSHDNQLTIEFWEQVFEGIRITYNFVSTYNVNSIPDTNSPFSNVRDVQMGKNLLWLSQKLYSDKKIIVWSTNFHVMRNFSDIEYPDSIANLTRNTTTMGDILWDQLNKKIYSITFTDFENYMTRNASNNTVEFLFEEAGLKYGFINLRDSANNVCLGNHYVSRLLGHQELNGKWNTTTDGIFFIKDIDKSTFKGE